MCGGGCKDVWRSGTGCAEDCRRTRDQMRGAGAREHGGSAARAGVRAVMMVWAVGAAVVEGRYAQVPDGVREGGGAVGV